MKTLTIKELIEAVESCGIHRPDGNLKDVSFDFCTAIPIYFGSWRGDYRMLSLNYKLTGGDNREGMQVITAGDFINMCKSAIGETFSGYKGGEFTMHEDSPVWVDNYGSSTETALVGVKSDDWNIYLKTAHLEY